VDVAPGMHTVDVQYIGYAAVSPRVTVTAGQTVTLDVQLGAPALEVCVGGSNAPTPSFTPFTTGPVLSNAAEAIAAIDTHYPAGLRAQGIGGTVRYWFFITSTGQVQAIRLDQSSGIRTLDGAGCEVAKVMKYSAALNVGVPVDVWVSVPITFQP